MRILLALHPDTVLPGLIGELVSQGLVVDVASTIAQARYLLEDPSHSALLIDRHLPDGDGLDVVRGLRLAGRRLPVLVWDLGAELVTRIFGLDAGADDYLSRPLAPEELAARIRARLRQCPFAGGRAIHFGPLVYDPDNGQAHVAGHLLDLSARETALLALLLERQGMVVTREEIETQVFGKQVGVSNVVDVTVHRLRQKLQRAGGQLLILTAKTVGYRLLPSMVSC